VRYLFDPVKDVSNQAKHGVSLALAEILFIGPYVSVSDDRFDYGEVREIAFGVIHGRLFVCVYVDRTAERDRTTERRVISLRKANKREVMRYGQSSE
jgi:uncharacterized DUF497 family protein